MVHFKCERCGDLVQFIGSKAHYDHCHAEFKCTGCTKIIPGSDLVCHMSCTVQHIDSHYDLKTYIDVVSKSPFPDSPPRKLQRPSSTQSNDATVVDIERSQGELLDPRESQDVIRSFKDAPEHISIHDFYHKVLVVLSDSSRAISCDLCVGAGKASVVQNCVGLLYIWAQGLDLQYLENGIETNTHLQRTVARRLVAIARIARLDLFLTRNATVSTDEIDNFEAQFKDRNDVEEENEPDVEPDVESDPDCNQDLIHVEHIAVFQELETNTNLLMDLLPTLNEYCTISQNVSLPQQQQQHSINAEPEILPLAQPYILQAQDKFPSISPKLAAKLGQANWRRYNRIKDWIQYGRDSQIQEPAIAVSEFRDSGLGTSKPDINHYAASNATHASYVTRKSQSSGDFLHVPNMPEPLSHNSLITCWICGNDLQLASQLEWKIHVFNDLQPYICTFDDCNLADGTFSTRQSWAEHEFGQHRNKRPSHHIYESRFETPIGFAGHEGESEPRAEQGSSNLPSDMQATIDATISEEKCPFCMRKNMQTRKAWVAHVCHHMEELALIVLPSMEDSEDSGNEDTNEEAQTKNPDSGPGSVRLPSDAANWAKGEQPGDSTRPELPNVCPFRGCGRAYKRKAELDRHTQEKHGPPSGRLLCPVKMCARGVLGDGFDRMSHLTQHLRSGKHKMTVSQARYLAREHNPRRRGEVI